MSDPNASPGAVDPEKEKQEARKAVADRTRTLIFLGSLIVALMVLPAIG
jgi:hypothetical protein